MLLNWAWVGGEAFLDIDQETPVDMESTSKKLMLVQSKTGEMVEIPKLTPNEAYCTLGAWIAADGNQQKQLEVLQEKMALWLDCTEKIL